MRASRRKSFTDARFSAPTATTRPPPGRSRARPASHPASPGRAGGSCSVARRPGDGGAVWRRAPPRVGPTLFTTVAKSWRRRQNCPSPPPSAVHFDAGRMKPILSALVRRAAGSRSPSRRNYADRVLYATHGVASMPVPPRSRVPSPSVQRQVPLQSVYCTSSAVRLINASVYRRLSACRLRQSAVTFSLNILLRLLHIYFRLQAYHHDSVPIPRNAFPRTAFPRRTRRLETFCGNDC